MKFNFWTLPEDKLNRTEVWTNKDPIEAVSRKEASKKAIEMGHKPGTYKIRIVE